MSADPTWPVITLAVVTALDGVACIGPIPFIRRALDRIDCPMPIRRLLPVVKLVAAAGLVAGLWIPGLGLVTCGALVIYFGIATWMHLRAQDAVLATSGAIGMILAVLIVAACFLAA